MALRVPKLVGSKWVYEYPVSAAQKPESNDGSEPNSEGNLLKDYWHQNHFKIGKFLTLYKGNKIGPKLQFFINNFLNGNHTQQTYLVKSFFLFKLK